MQSHSDKSSENTSKAAANNFSKKKLPVKPGMQFIDNRVEAIAQKKMQDLVNNSTKENQLPIAQLKSPPTIQMGQSSSKTKNLPAHTSSSSSSSSPAPVTASTAPVVAPAPINSIPVANSSSLSASSSSNSASIPTIPNDVKENTILLMYNLQFPKRTYINLSETQSRGSPWVVGEKFDTLVQRSEVVNYLKKMEALPQDAVGVPENIVTELNKYFEKIRKDVSDYTD